MSDFLPGVTLAPFQPADQAEVKSLILAGLGEHWGEIDHTLNPDLNNIATSYAGATFLVARFQGKIVGTGALVPRQNGTVEIVRMSVSAAMRRRGIGRLILQQLIEHARAQGFCRVVLETTEAWDDVIAFYLDYGFQITHWRDGDVYFAIELLPK
jgi:GNAT superfamily N-acetyltransferase